MEKLCGYLCSMPNCTNRIRTDLVLIGESSILPGERRLFANSAIPKDTPIADFGPVRELRKGEKGKETELGYSIPVSQEGSSRKWVDAGARDCRACYQSHMRSKVSELRSCPHGR